MKIAGRDIGVKRRIDAARYLVRNARAYLTGPPDVTFLVAQTLDRDAVSIARKALKDRSKWFDAGVVSDYAAEFAKWNGSRYAFAFMGGRVALSACIHALDLKEGDEVIVPAYTCVVVPNAFRYAGVTVVYSDIELDTYGLDVTQLEDKITPRTRAIVLQHLYGIVCRDYEAILDFAMRHGLKVIEDCAHSTGAEYKGMKVGNRGDVAFYSSNRAKVFSTVEGGIAVTSDELLCDRLKAYYDKASFPDGKLIDKLLHNVLLDFYSCRHPKRHILRQWAYIMYGDKWHYSTSQDELEGRMPVNYVAKMPAPLASLGLDQLKKMDDYNEKRRHTAARWDRWCEIHGYRRPVVIEDSTPVFLRYPVLAEQEKKSDGAWAAKELGIELGVWFTGKLHPVDVRIEGCPNADKAVRGCINFPTLMDEKCLGS